jgi:hypothetical protein
VAFILVLLIMFSSLFLLFRYMHYNKRLVSLLAQEAIDKVAVIRQLQDLQDKKESKPIEQTEGFLRFVSESRDWAFQYIEQVQQEIKEFESVATPIIYKDNVVSKEYEQLAVAYEKLLKQLPEATELGDQDGK